MFLVSTPPSRSPLVLSGHPALSPPRSESASRVTSQSRRSHEFVWDSCYPHHCARSTNHLLRYPFSLSKRLRFSLSQRDMPYIHTCIYFTFVNHRDTFTRCICQSIHSHPVCVNQDYFFESPAQTHTARMCVCVYV